MATARNNISINPTGKEPWLAVNLSTLIPGIGQIYAGQKIRGWLFIFSYFLLIILGLGLLVTSKLYIGIVCFVAAIIIYFWNLFDAYQCAKRANSSDFETWRRGNKDPWLAVFLSRIILGLGHLYINKTLVGFVLVFITVVSYFVTSDSPISGLLTLVSLLASPFILYHAYIKTPVQRNTSRRSILITAIILAFAPIILAVLSTLSIRTFIAEARWIPSEAMVPTLQKNDRLVIDKLSYHFAAPQRGDIIVFSPTETIKKDNPNLKDAFIKRIIGLPGEKVEVKAGKVYISDSPLEENYIKSPPQYQYGPVTVTQNSYFVLGDNRNNSYDSHFWGFVPRKNIIGRASEIFFPLERAGSLK